jgi:hypothetical protein
MLGGARRPLAVLVGALQLCTACYQYVPLRSPPAVGARVALEINDDGRLALREQLGPNIVRVEGRVSALDGDALVVEALNVTQIRGQALPVDSVQVRVVPQHVDRMDERRLSRSRTWLFIGGAAAVVAAFLLSGGIGGSSPVQEQPGGPPVNQYRGH